MKDSYERELKPLDSNISKRRMRDRCSKADLAGRIAYKSTVTY